MTLASAAIVLAAVLAARALRSAGDPDLDHVLTVGTFVVGAVLVVSLTVGLPGFYRPLPLLVGAMALALLVAGLCRGKGLRRHATARERLCVREIAARLVTSARREPLAAVAVGLAVLALLNRVLMAVLLQPGRFDAIAYHLVFVADWVQRGVIGGGELQRATCCEWYPVSAEVAYAWLAVFVHSDRLVGLAQVGSLALAGLATASIARSVGAPDRYAAVAGSLFVLTPVALRQANTNLVDVSLATGVLVTTAFAFRIATAPRAARADVVRFAVAVAVTLGIKASAAAYVAAICALLGAYAVVTRRRTRGEERWRRVLLAAALVASLAVVGSGWYIRAWAATGNPVWPYRVEVLDRTVFAGPKDPEAVNPTPPPLERLPPILHAPRSWVHDLDVDFSLRRNPYDPDGRLGGLGLVWLFVGIPASVAALLLSLRHRDWRFAGLVLAIAPVALVTTPDPWFARFMIPLVAVGLAGYAYTAGRVPRRAATAITAVAIALGVIGVIESRPLEGLARLLNTPGAPVNRPPALLDERRYAPLHDLPADARVGVVLGSPLLPYLVVGGQFSRYVVPLPRRPESPQELARFMEARDLDYLVTRVPLPGAVVEDAGIRLVDEASGATVYRRVAGRLEPAPNGA